MNRGLFKLTITFVKLLPLFGSQLIYCSMYYLDEILIRSTTTAIIFVIIHD